MGIIIYHKNIIPYFFIKEYKKMKNNILHLIYCKINLKVHNCCAVNFVIGYNIPQAIYLSFKGGILS
jgi:hypothetical protein